jgi:hypothetical protein
MPSATSSVDASSVVGEFWAGIRQPDLGPLVSSTRERIISVCPVIDTFSFDLIDDEEAAAGTLRETPVVSVETGTPRPVVTAWNENKLVGVIVFRSGVQCGAAVGDVGVSVKDFKACSLPLEGETKCTAGTHVGPRVKRIAATSEDPILAIAVPASTPSPKQVFSRPFLEQADFVHLPWGSPHFVRLLSLRMEPRVWKTLFELFPGPQVFYQGPPPPIDTFSSEAFQPRVGDTVGVGRDLVSEAPFTTPIGRDGQGTQPYQVEEGEGWRFSDTGSHSTSPPPPRGDSSAPAIQQRREQRAQWAGLFQRSDSNRSQRSQSSGSSQTTPVPDPTTTVPLVAGLFRLLTVLKDRVDTLEEEAKARESDDLDRELEMGKVFKAFADKNARILAQLKEAQKEIQALSGTSVRTAASGLSLLSRDLASVVARVGQELNVSQYATSAELNALRPAANLPSDLVTRLAALEAEMFQSAGSIPTLLARVEQLEAAKMITAVEIGGFVFVDEAATEAWVATHRDPDLVRFCPDFVTLFLLADPKFDTVEAGLEQSAAVAKAQFSFLDVATAVLSYSIVYPSNLIKKSDRADAQQDGGVVWAPSFASHEVFEGDYNNGTHLRLKKDLTAAAKSIEAGIDYHFSASLHPKTNAVFRAQVRYALTQCTEFLDALTPLHKQISGGGMSGKESWSRVMIFAKQIFEDIRTVRAPNVAASTGSRILASFRTTEILKEYQRHNWVEHPKTSAILALTSMRKEGKAIEELSSKVQSHSSQLNQRLGDIKKLQEDLKDLKKKNPSLL